MPRYAGITWSVPISVIREGVARIENAFMPALTTNMTNAANEVLAWAQANHPWTNRTSMAQNTFDVSVTHGGRRVTYAYGVDYGIYLAFKHGGKWDVIRPAMEMGSPIFRDAMEQTLKDAMGAA